MEFKASGEITLIFLVFLVLKLTHVIDWSWLWITAPIWIPFCIVTLLFGTIYLLGK